MARCCVRSRHSLPGRPPLQLSPTSHRHARPGEARGRGDEWSEGVPLHEEGKRWHDRWRPTSSLTHVHLAAVFRSLAQQSRLIKPLPQDAREFSARPQRASLARSNVKTCRVWNGGSASWDDVCRRLFLNLLPGPYYLDCMCFPFLASTRRGLEGLINPPV